MSRRSMFFVFVLRANNSSCNVTARTNEMGGLRRYRPVRVSLSPSKIATCRNMLPFPDDGEDDIQRPFPDLDLHFNVYSQLEERHRIYTPSILPLRHLVLVNQ